MGVRHTWVLILAGALAIAILVHLGTADLAWISVGLAIHATNRVVLQSAYAIIA